MFLAAPILRKVCLWSIAFLSVAELVALGSHYRAIVASYCSPGRRLVGLVVSKGDVIVTVKSAAEPQCPALGVSCSVTKAWSIDPRINLDCWDDGGLGFYGGTPRARSFQDRWKLVGIVWQEGGDVRANHVAPAHTLNGRPARRPKAAGRTLVPDTWSVFVPELAGALPATFLFLVCGGAVIRSIRRRGGRAIRCGFSLGPTNGTVTFTGLSNNDKLR